MAVFKESSGQGRDLALREISRKQPIVAEREGRYYG
jgi:hypothetical protein